MDAFVAMAQMSEKQFTAERDVQVVNSTTIVAPALTDQVFLKNFLTEKNVKNPQYKPLKIPRRPPWSTEMPVAELNKQENVSRMSN